MPTHTHVPLLPLLLRPLRPLAADQPPPPRAVRATLRSVLRDVGLEGLTESMEAQHVTLGHLAAMDDDQLRSLGVGTVGARLRLRMVAGAAIGLGGGVQSSAAQ